MIKVLFVCLGNICRSPLAEGIFNKLIEDQGLKDNFYVDSAGTSDYHIGESPDPRTLQCAKDNDLLLDSKGRQFHKEDFKKFDHFIVMDKSNYDDVIALAEYSEDKEKVHLMREFDPSEEGMNVPDPYFGGEDGFREVYDILERSCKKLLESLKNEHNL